jgi:SAM-dependent MidA family methyltransferase
MPLPTPDAAASEHSTKLCKAIAQEIAAGDGFMPFARYMELALYAPGFGYYSGGAHKFGAAGDFVTAPGLTALFGQALATQCRQIMALSEPQILEAGAGTGRLAADLLATLAAEGAAPERYRILELSADLRARQRQTLADTVPELLDRVEWLDTLPERIVGVLLGNEVLDAMPVHLVRRSSDGFFERGARLAAATGFEWDERPAVGAVADAARALADECAIGDDYLLEINLATRAWVAECSRRLERGALLLLDYGFPRREYYHPQRGNGTLMCHYRHHAHDDPFFLPGLQDITAHVDFTLVAEAAHGAGLDILGYSSQAQFLMNCGLLDRLARLPAGTADYVRATGAVQKLISPAEMGEFFKVIAAGRGIAEPLLGFARGDRLHSL